MMIMGSKKCTRCGLTKKFSEFHKNKGGRYGLEPQCKKCRIEYKRHRTNIRKDLRPNYRGKKKCRNCKQKLFKRDFSKTLSNKDFLSSICKGCDTAKPYGLNKLDVIALLENQSYHCYLCGRKQNDIKLCIDHKHQPGKNKSSCDREYVRGMLCHGCNILVGDIENNMTLHPTSRNDYLQTNIGRDILNYIENPPAQKILSKKPLDKEVNNMLLLYQV